MPQVYEPEFKRKLVHLHLEEGRSYKSLTYVDCQVKLTHFYV